MRCTFACICIAYLDFIDRVPIKAEPYNASDSGNKRQHDSHPHVTQLERTEVETWIPELEMLRP